MAYLINLRESVFVRHSTFPRNLVAIPVHTLADIIYKIAKRKQKALKDPSTLSALPSPLSESAASDMLYLTKSPSSLPSPLPETSVEVFQSTSEAVDGLSKQAKASASLI